MGEMVALEWNDMDLIKTAAVWWSGPSGKAKSTCRRVEDFDTFH